MSQHVLILLKNQWLKQIYTISGTLQNLLSIEKSTIYMDIITLKQLTKAFSKEHKAKRDHLFLLVHFLQVHRNFLPCGVGTADQTGLISILESLFYFNQVSVV